MFIPAINSALGGLAGNQQRLANAAERIARFGTGTAGDEVDLTRELVNVRFAKHGYAANLVALKTADEMLGSLLDVFA